MRRRDAEHEIVSAKDIALAMAPTPADDPLAPG